MFSQAVTYAHETPLPCIPETFVSRGELTGLSFHTLHGIATSVACAVRVRMSLLPPVLAANATGTRWLLLLLLLSVCLCVNSRVFSYIT
jgi:hypothetical protein